MGVADYARALVHGWRLLVAGLIVGAAAAYGLLQLETPLYQANIQLFVSTSASDDLTAALQGGQFSQQRTASYAQLLVSRDLAASVVKDLGLDAPPEQVQGEITASVVPLTVILSVTVTDPSPQRALDIAASVGRQFSALVERLETPPTATASPVTVSTIAQPVLPAAPVSPDPKVYLAAGLLAGFLLAATIAVVRDRLDTRISSEDEAGSAAAAPVLGLLPDEPPGNQPSSFATPGTPSAEAIRILRSNLQFVSVGNTFRTLMVTSSEQGEAKTTTAIRLAQALAEGGLRVLLLEADLRRPRATRYLGLVSGVGLTNLLTRSASIEEVLQPIGGDGRLTVLGAGPNPPNPSELLASQAMADVLAALSATYDVVVIDAPPLLPVADGTSLAGLVDGALLCVRFGHTQREAVERSRLALDRVGTRTLGVVLTFVPRGVSGAYEYTYSDLPNDHPRGIRRLLRRRSTQDEAALSLPHAVSLRPARPRTSPPVSSPPVDVPRTSPLQGPDDDAGAVPTSEATRSRVSELHRPPATPPDRSEGIDHDGASSRVADDPAPPPPANGSAARAAKGPTPF